MLGCRAQGTETGGARGKHRPRGRGARDARRVGACIERQPLVDDVHDVLVDMLMNHTLPPGGRLNIDALARTLGVSPTPVREALARIEAEGLVVKEPRRGYTVAPADQPRRPASPDRLPAAHRARGGRGRGRRQRPPEDARHLRAFARSGGAGDNDATANRLDMIYDATFHDTIAELGGNPWLRESLARLRSHLHMYRLYHHAGQAAATKPEHVADRRGDRRPGPRRRRRGHARPPAHRDQADRRRLRLGQTSDRQWPLTPPRRGGGAG